MDGDSPENIDGQRVRIVFFELFGSFPVSRHALQRGRLDPCRIYNVSIRLDNHCVPEALIPTSKLEHSQYPGLWWNYLKGSYMIRHQAGKVARPVEDSIGIVRGLTRAQSVTPLPEHISCNTLGIQGRRLPGSLNAAMAGGIAILLQKTGLAGSDTCVAVGLDPGGTPRACLTPC